MGLGWGSYPCLSNVRQVYKLLRCSVIGVVLGVVLGVYPHLSEIRQVRKLLSCSVMGLCWVWMPLEDLDKGVVFPYLSDIKQVHKLPRRSVIGSGLGCAGVVCLCLTDIMP